MRHQTIGTYSTSQMSESKAEKMAHNRSVRIFEYIRTIRTRSPMQPRYSLPLIQRNSHSVFFSTHDIKDIHCRLINKSEDEEVEQNLHEHALKRWNPANMVQITELE